MLVVGETDEFYIRSIIIELISLSGQVSWFWPSPFQYQHAHLVSRVI